VTYPNDAVSRVLEKDARRAVVSKSRRCGWRWWRPALTPGEPDSASPRDGRVARPVVIVNFAKADRGNASQRFSEEYAEPCSGRFAASRATMFSRSTRKVALLVYVVGVAEKCHYPAASRPSLFEQASDGFYAPAQFRPQRQTNTGRSASGDVHFREYV